MADADKARLAAYEEALTPSVETKIAYMGEFTFWDTEMDEDGNEHRIRRDVPWPTVKEIMKRIKNRARFVKIEGQSYWVGHDDELIGPLDAGAPTCTEGNGSEPNY